MKTQKLFLLILAMLLVDGCVMQTPPPAIEQATTTQTIMPTFLPTQTRTPFPSHTSTINEPTFTPGPTLTATETNDLINRINSPDGICSLPCWAGITPGKSHWNDVFSFLDSFSKIRKHSLSQPKGYTLFVSTSETSIDDEIWFATIYLDENSIVEFLNGNGIRISISELLTKYGKPDEIRLFILGVLPEDKIEEFSLLIIYREMGFFLVFESETTNQPMLDICPPLAKIGSNFWTWNVANANAFTTINTKKSYSSYWDSWEEYKEISIATNGRITVDSFFDTYSVPDSDNLCFQVQSPYADDMRAP